MERTPRSDGAGGSGTTVRRWAGWELKFTDRAEEAEDLGCWELLRRSLARSAERLLLVRLNAGREGKGTVDEDALLTEFDRVGTSDRQDWAAREEGVGRPWMSAWQSSQTRESTMGPIGPSSRETSAGG